MEGLEGRLEAVQRDRASAAADAAIWVITTFRSQAAAGTLAVSGGPRPHYVFDPRRLTPPAGAAFAAGDWERFSGLVLAILEELSGMSVRWGGASTPIELRPRSRAPTPPPGKMSATP